jgi:hypothetical protein
MRLAFILLISLLLPHPTSPQEGIPQNIGIGKYPEGLLDNTDIKSLMKMRIETLKQKVQVLENQFSVGTLPDSILYDAQQELLMAQLESTTDKQTRLKFIEESLANALKIWQIVEAKADVGLSGGEKDSVLTFQEQVYHFRIMWLKEKQTP